MTDTPNPTKLSREVQAGDCLGRFERNSNKCTKCGLSRIAHQDYNETEHSPAVQDVDRCIECGHNNGDENGICQEPGQSCGICGCKCEFPSPSVSAWQHHKNCAIWTVTTDGAKKECDCAQPDSMFKGSPTDKPIDMLLFCPNCWEQHIDAEESEHDFENRRQAWSLGAEWQDSSPTRWLNPPHRSHQCHKCFAVWRPADVPTNGVAQISTQGAHDTWIPCTPVQVDEVSAALEKLREMFPDVQIIVSIRDCGKETMTVRGTSLEYGIQIGMNGEEFDADTLFEAIAKVREWQQMKQESDTYTSMFSQTNVGDD